MAPVGIREDLPVHLAVNATAPWDRDHVRRGLCDPGLGPYGLAYRAPDPLVPGHHARAGRGDGLGA